MTRLSTLLVVLGMFMMLVVAVPAYADPPGPIPADPPGIERVIFIHYPHQGGPPDGVKPPNAGGGGGGGNACPDATTCGNYKYSGYRWAGSAMPVPYALDTSGSGVSSGAPTAISAAFSEWTSKTSGQLSINLSTRSMDCSTAAGAINGNQICWRSFSGTSWSGAIAVTSAAYNFFTKDLVETDVIFNNGQGFAWAYTPPSGVTTSYTDPGNIGPSDRYDIRNIATHEFGHALAWLGDLYGKRDVQLTMYGYGSMGELKKDTLGKGDCLGISAAYPGYTCP